MKNGSVRAIRCNNDGYVVGVGVILAEWYTDIKKVKIDYKFKNSV